MAEEKKEKKELRLIVRIVGKDLDGNLPVYKAIQDIKGIGHRAGRAMAFVFESETGIPFDSKIGELNEELDKRLEEIILNPGKHGVPGWVLNRRREFETGIDTHRVMAELDFALRKDLQRLNEIKSYRGLRHSWGLPVRGQKTKSTHRGKGGVIGVIKKEVAKAQAAAGKGEKREEKK
jgi:small subunit ribosomal protein S13